jgi:hypothetical protein
MPIKDKEARLKYIKEWALQDYHKHPEKYRERSRASRENNPARRLITSTKRTAKIKNLEHNITAEDLVLPKFCPLLGIEIDYSAGNGKNLSNPSVDRIDPTKGYIKGNVEVMSMFANIMKSKASNEQLITFAKNVLRKYSNEG